MPPPKRKPWSPPPDPWLPKISAALHSPKALDLLSARELFVLAFQLFRATTWLTRHYLPLPKAAELLIAYGLPPRINTAKLIDRMARSCGADPRFEVDPERGVFLLRPEHELPAMLTELFERPDIARLAARAAAPPPPATPPITKPLPTVAPAAPVVLGPEWPAAATFETPPPVLAPVGEHSLRDLLRAPPTALATVRRTLAAHALAALESFEELVAFRTLRGVDAHRYQIETVRRVLRTLRGRCLLADEVGLGKTIEAIITLREYQLRGMVRRALVITPSPLVAQWAGELSSKAGITARTTEDPAFREDPEAFWAAEGVIVASLPLVRATRHAAAVQARPWDMVVVDEAHHIKNRTTLGWKLINELRSRFLLLVTATPIENDLEEIYNLVTLLRPGQFTTPAAFRKEYVDPKDPTSPKNRERLRGLLAEVMVRNTRAQSGLKLPPRFVTTVQIEPDADEQGLYGAVLDLFRTHASTASTRMAVSTLLLEAGSSPQALHGGLTRMMAGEKHPAGFRKALGTLETTAKKITRGRKVEALLEIVRGHQEPVLVFSRYRDSLDTLVNALQHSGIPHASFHGGMTAEARRHSLDAFRAAPAGRPMVLAATDVGGEGQNLQHCHVLVNFDLPWNPMLIEQRIGRLHRMGQTEEVRVYNLCAKGTVEDRVLDVLDRRVHLFELVVGEMDMVLGNMSDDRDLEERILALYAESSTEDDVTRGFDALADEMLAARRRYEKTRTLDEALFGRDYEA